MQKQKSYIEELICQLKIDYQRKQEMEKDFRREMMEDYDILCDKITNNVIELLKSGIEYTDDGKTISIQLEEDFVIDILKSDIEQQRVAWKYGREPRYYQGQQNVNNTPYNQMMNPMMIMSMPMFMNMMGSMMGGYQNPNMGMSGYAYKEPIRIEENEEITDMQRKIFVLEKEKQELKKTNETLKETNAVSETEINNVKQELSSAKNAVEQYKRDKETDKKRILELEQAVQAEKQHSEAELRKITERADKENNKVAEDTKQVVEKIRREAQDEMNKKITEMQEMLDKAVEDKKNAENSLGKAEEKISAIENQLNNEKEQKQKILKQREADQEYIQKIKSEKNELNNQISSLKAKNNEKKNNNMKNDFEKQLSNMKKNYEKKLADVKSEMNKQAGEYENTIAGMQEQIDYLQYLAYTDVKTDFKNTNAFNEEFSSHIPAETQLALISICGLEEINAEKGKEFGNAVMTQTANELADLFGADCVYRITGTDRFMILLTDNNYKTIAEKCQEIKTTLANENIKIVYGIAIGSKKKQHGDIISEAETKIAEMKANEQKRTDENSNSGYVSYPEQDDDCNDVDVDDNDYNMDDDMLDTLSDYASDL